MYIYIYIHHCIFRVALLFLRVGPFFHRLSDQLPDEADFGFEAPTKVQYERGGHGRMKRTKTTEAGNKRT